MVDQEQRAFTMWKVAVDWQEPTVLQHKCGHPLPVLTDIGPCTVAASNHTTAPINHARPSPRSIHQMSPHQPRWQLSLILCVSSCLLFACFHSLQFMYVVLCTRAFVMLLIKGNLLTYLLIENPLTAHYSFIDLERMKG